jgi:hypothetical protein
MSVRQTGSSVACNLWTWVSLLSWVMLTLEFAMTKANAANCPSICITGAFCMQSGGSNAGTWQLTGAGEGATCPQFYTSNLKGMGSCTGSSGKNWVEAQSAAPPCAPAGSTNAYIATCKATGTNTVSFPCCTNNCAS